MVNTAKLHFQEMLMGQRKSSIKVGDFLASAWTLAFDVVSIKAKMESLLMPWFS